MGRVRPWHAALLAGAAVSATVCFLACVDTTPFTVPNAQTDAAPPDVLVDVNVGDASRDAKAEADVEAGPSPCVQCLQAADMMGYGCGNELAACDNNPKCAQALACAFSNDCFDQGSVPALIQCGSPCATQAGITLTDPAIDLAYAVFTCAPSHCGHYCRLGGD